MAILEWFKNMINKLLGRVGVLEEEMEKQKKTQIIIKQNLKNSKKINRP